MLMNQESLFIFYIASILLALAVLVVLRILSGLQNVAGYQLYSRLSLICWAAIIGGIIGIVITSPFALFSIALLVAVIIVGILVVVSAVVTATVRPYHLSQQNALLWSMAISAEKMIPLVPTIEAFARDRTGLIAAKAQKLAKLLESGVPLPEAIERVPGILPSKVLPIIRVGYESGALGAALRQAVSSRDIFGIIWNSLFTKLLYITLVISFGISILIFMLTKIVPSYAKIFKDFGTSLPGITTALISTSSFIVNAWYIFLPFYLLFMGLILYFMFCYLDWASFYFPGITRLLRRRHSAIILDSLALAAENNQPLGRNISTLAACYPQRGIRQKLNRVGQDISQGADWCESLRRRGLIKRADQAVLQAAQRVGNLPWAMREMADSNRRRLAYRLNALVQLAYPPVILCLGMAVMFVVVALFYPSFTLIMKLVGQ